MGKLVKEREAGAEVGGGGRWLNGPRFKKKEEEKEDTNKKIRGRPKL